MVKLEPKQKKEESVVAEKKDVARELVQKLLDHKQLFEEKEEVIAKKDEQPMEREEELARMEKQLAEKDDQLAEKDVQLAEKLAEKDVQLAERDVQLAEKDAQLAGRDVELGEMEKQLAEMGNRLTKKEDEMASLAEHSSDLIQMKSQEIEDLKAVTTSGKFAVTLLSYNVDNLSTCSSLFCRLPPRHGGGCWYNLPPHWEQANPCVGGAWSEAAHSRRCSPSLPHRMQG